MSSFILTLSPVRLSSALFATPSTRLISFLPLLALWALAPWVAYASTRPALYIWIDFGWSSLSTPFALLKGIHRLFVLVVLVSLPLVPSTSTRSAVLA